MDSKEPSSAPEDRTYPVHPFLTFDPSSRERTSSGGRHRRRETDAAQPDDQVEFMGHPLTAGRRDQEPSSAKPTDKAEDAETGYPGFPPVDVLGESATPETSDLVHDAHSGDADHQNDEFQVGAQNGEGVHDSPERREEPEGHANAEPAVISTESGAGSESTVTRVGRRYPHAKFWSTVAASVASLMMTLDMTIVLVALPTIGKSLNLSLSGAQWVVNAYTLAFAALLLGVGSLSDLVGRRGIFIAGQVVFVAASVGCLSADTEGWMIAARVVQGAGGAMVFGSSLPLLSDVFGPGDQKQRTSAVAIFMSAGAAAVALGPLVGGAIVEYVDWRWIFAINIPIGVLIIVGTLIGVPKNGQQWRDHMWEERKQRLLYEGRADEVEKLSNAQDTDVVPPISWLTLIIASVFLFALNYALLTGPDDGWTDGKVLIACGVSLAGVVMLVWMQLAKGDKAMIDIRMFAIPSFSAVTIVAFAGRLFSFGMMPYIVLWLSGAVGLSSLEVGYVTTALAIPIIVFSAVAIPLGKKIRVSAIQALGMIVIAAGLLLGLKMQAHSGWQDIVPMYVVVGIGTGLMLPHLMDVAVSVVAPRKTGTATGIANTAFPLGTSFGVAIYGAIITHATSLGLKGVSFPTASIAAAHPAVPVPPGAPAPPSPLPGAAVPPGVASLPPGVHPNTPLPPGAVLSPDKKTITMDAPQKIVDLASSGQFEIIRKHAPMFVDKALESYINGLHNLLVLAAILAAAGALVALVFIRDKDRYEVRHQKKHVG